MNPRGFLFRFISQLLGASLVIGAAVFIASTGPPELRGTWGLIICTLIAAIILVIANALLRWHNWLVPIRQIQQSAARMASGDWNTRVNPTGSTIIRQLAADLNLLGAQAQKQLTDLQQQRGGLQALVDTLPDPILAADAQGRVILLNAPAAALLQLLPSQAINQKLVSVVNNEQIVELYEELRDHRSKEVPALPLHREIRLARNGQRATYQAVAAATLGQGALLVLRDVSTLAGAVQMKTDFVANASHELRTPIAAIKIAFETLRDVYREDPAQTERCMTVIDGHLKRLEEMLRDLLDLSRVESPELAAHVSPVKTSELLALIRSTMGAMARQKNVELRLGDGDPSTPEQFYSDARLLNLVLKNLVENSIKFTAAGGSVTISVHENAPSPGSKPAAAGSVSIRVTDTGIGIAPEHLDRVFERFYQVDAARSGSAGRGTGLGLAIVKHAVHALSGTITIDSKVGIGTTVTCELPQTVVGEASEASV